MVKRHVKNRRSAYESYEPLAAYHFLEFRIRASRLSGEGESMGLLLLLVARSFWEMKN